VAAAGFRVLTALLQPSGGGARSRDAIAVVEVSLRRLREAGMITYPSDPEQVPAPGVFAAEVRGWLDSTRSRGRA